MDTKKHKLTTGCARLIKIITNEGGVISNRYYERADRDRLEYLVQIGVLEIVEDHGPSKTKSYSLISYDPEKSGKRRKLAKKAAFTFADLFEAADVEVPRAIRTEATQTGRITARRPAVQETIAYEQPATRATEAVNPGTPTAPTRQNLFDTVIAPLDAVDNNTIGDMRTVWTTITPVPLENIQITTEVLNQTAEIQGTTTAINPVNTRIRTENIAANTAR